MKTFNSPKYPKFTFKKGNIFYYSRAVPKDIVSYYSCPRIVTSLRTKSFIEARMASQVYSSKLEQYWLSLRLQNIEIPAFQMVNSNNCLSASKLLTIIEARDLYFEVKGKGRPKLFFDTASRNIKYLTDCLGVKPIDLYTSKDAASFREWLLTESVALVIGGA